MGYVKPIDVTDLCVYCNLYFKFIRVYLLYLLLRVCYESVCHMTLETSSSILLSTFDGIKRPHEGIVLYHLSLSDVFDVHTKMKSPSGTFPRIYPRHQVVGMMMYQYLDVLTL